MIINVTVRDDYTEDNLPPMDQHDYNFSRYGYYIYFDVLLYNKNGAVDTRGVVFCTQNGSFGTYTTHRIGVDRGETRNFDIYVATDNWDIEPFEIMVKILVHK